MGGRRIASVFQLLLKGCTIEAFSCQFIRFWAYGFSCCWKDVRLKLSFGLFGCRRPTFQLLLKGCTIEAQGKIMTKDKQQVSVVVERMYDWSSLRWISNSPDEKFQLLLKGCTIEAFLAVCLVGISIGFSCCWKDVRLKLYKNWTS